MAGAVLLRRRLRRPLPTPAPCTNAWSPPELGSCQLAPATIGALEQAVRTEAYFYLSDEEVATSRYQTVFRNEAITRYDICARYIVPWLTRHRDISDAVVVDYGCGAGVMTAALAPLAESVHAYDVQETAVNLTRRRMEIMGLDNYTVTQVAAETALETLHEQHPGGIGAIVLFAVLEHLPVAQRISLLRGLWDVLREDGILLVGDTPNRLQYTDDHTSQLEFFNMLPEDLALLYAEKSPRPEFREAMAAALEVSQTRAVAELNQWGRGVSHHEFELALGSLDGLVIADGFDPEIRALMGVTPEETALRDFVGDRGLRISPAFAATTSTQFSANRHGTISRATAVRACQNVRRCC